MPFQNPLDQYSHSDMNQRQINRISQQNWLFTSTDKNNIQEGYVLKLPKILRNLDDRSQPAFCREMRHRHLHTNNRYFVDPRIRGVL